MSVQEIHSIIDHGSERTEDVPLVIGIFLMVLAMVSLGNLGLNIANSRDIAKTNAKLNTFINNKDTRSVGGASHHEA